MASLRLHRITKLNNNLITIQRRCLSSIKFSTTTTTTTNDKSKLLDENNLLKFNTLHELGTNAISSFNSNPLFGTHNEDKNAFEWMNYTTFGGKVNLCRRVLKDIGVKEYSKVGIIANNRWEWACIAMACYSLNAALVPMYEAQLSKDWLYILNDSECSAVFCATKDIFDKVQYDVLPNAHTVKASLCLNSELGQPEAFATAMAQAAAASSHDNDNDNDARMCAPTTDDLANLIYTSGTTGKPKGVELTHNNFATNVKGPTRMVNDPFSELVNSSDRSLSFLPWAHSYGQTCELWMLMSTGASLGLCRGFPSILEDLQLVKPTMIFSVPTLYKRIYDGVNNMIENSSPFKQRLMKSALHLGRIKSEQKQFSILQSVQFKVLDAIVSKKIRDKFGGKLRHGFCAGAACPKEVLQFMDNIGIKICEGYGLTETSPIISINSTQHRRVGSVGSPLPGVTVLICDEDGKALPVGQEGEICCFGPNVMRGYYKRPDATNEVLTIAPDGHSRLFHTGDLGKVDEDGFVYVTGRLKELYKLENGKYVCPTPIEEAISMSRFVSQVVLCGANREYNVALIVPDFAIIRSHLSLSDDNNYNDDISEEDIVNLPEFKLLIDTEISKSCQRANLKRYEQPEQWSIVAPFTAANNMLTPKLSIRRHKVIKFYDDLIDGMYQNDTPPYSADGVHHHDGDDIIDQADQSTKSKSSNQKEKVA